MPGDENLNPFIKALQDKLARDHLIDLSKESSFADTLFLQLGTRRST